MTDQLWYLAEANQLEVASALDIANKVADVLVTRINKVLANKPFFVLTTSAGKTLKQTYAVLRQQYRSEVDWSRVICVQMDEYCNLSCEDSQSFAFELQTEIINPLGIGRFMHFYNQNGNEKFSLADYEVEIRKLGGLDVGIHGIGRNGHIAFNEPQHAPVLETRLIELDASTKAANGIEFENGVTLGMRILSEADTSIVVMLGETKKEAATKFLFNNVEPENPAAYLRLCNHVYIYMDDAATPAKILH